LRDKIRLSSFIALVFRTPPDKRIISFADIAANTKLPLAEVEFLVMKALSLGLVRGKIDAVCITSCVFCCRCCVRVCDRIPTLT